MNTAQNKIECVLVFHYYETLYLYECNTACNCVCWCTKYRRNTMRLFNCSSHRLAVKINISVYTPLQQPVCYSSLFLVKEFVFIVSGSRRCSVEAECRILVLKHVICGRTVPRQPVVDRPAVKVTVRLTFAAIRTET